MQELVKTYSASDPKANNGGADCALYRNLLLLQNDELVSAQAVIRRETEKNDALFGGFPLPLAIMDAKADILRANDAFYSMIGCRYLTNSKRSFFNYTDKDGSDRVLSAIDCVNNNTSPEPVPVSIMSTGDPCPAVMNVSAYDSAYLFVFAPSACDGGDCRLNTDELKLVESGKMLRAIAHQWKQPLNAMNMIIANFIDDVRESQVSDDNIKEFENISGQLIHHMSLTVKDFIEFLQPEETEEIFDLKDTLPLVANIMKPVLNSNKIECIAECSCGSCLLDMVEAKKEMCKNHHMYVAGNKGAFQQALLNLLSNAAEAVSDCDVRKIIIKLEDGGDKYLIHISDTGKGIPADALRHIFEADFTTKQSGSGLGLYIAQRLITRIFSGTICLAENSGKGAKFIISLNKHS